MCKRCDKAKLRLQHVCMGEVKEGEYSYVEVVGAEHLGLVQMRNGIFRAPQDPTVQPKCYITIVLDDCKHPT